MPLSTPTSRYDRAIVVLALAALAALFLCIGAQYLFVDPDLWHEMALMRESLALGRLPLEDRFAYTPTVYPVIHHEWGTGLILYFVATAGGSAGLLTLKYLLSTGVAAGCFVCARKRGASFAVLCSLASLPIILSWGGFTTIRAQMFTWLLLACLLYALDRDRERQRWWIGPWLALFVLWVNLHAGFVVGLALCLFHGVEQFIRRQPVRHLILVMLAMVALIAVNPYGRNYYPYLWRGLRMDRPLIPEWAPLWEVWAPILVSYLLSLLIVGYCVYRIGVRKMPGVILVLITGYAALRHQRHLSLYAVTWLCYVPAYVERTKLGEMLTGFWTRRRLATLSLWAAVGLAGTTGLIAQRPWRLRLPANSGDHPLFTYPVGAVEYLDEVAFCGNLMVPFRVGAFVTWKLYPDVKVSIDGRYEVAYPPGALAETKSFYAGESGWQRTLSRYPTDAALLPTDSPVSAAMPQVEGWTRVYVDDVYEIYTRPGLALRQVDRRGKTFAGTFP